MEHNKPNWDKLQAISVLTSDSPKLGPALKKNPYIVYKYKGDIGQMFSVSGPICMLKWIMVNWTNSNTSNANTFIK